MKKPKMPKANASLSVWKNYEDKLKALEEKKKVIERVKAKRGRI